jgi:hypothetical protein
MSNDVVVARTLTQEEDTFALAVIEYGGNMGAAYRAAYGPDVNMPIAKARELITRPEVAKRIQELTLVTEEHALISLGSHLMQLAQIRDNATDNKQLKVALDAEKARGQVAGFYTDKGPKPKDPNAGGGAKVFIQIGNTPANTQAWAQQYGNQPVVLVSDK